MSGIKDFLATKLATGAPGAPPRGAWWPAHLRAVTECINAIEGPKEDFVSTRACAVAHATEWDRLIPSSAPRGLMERHMEMEAALIIAAKNRNPALIDRIGELLTANAAAQARGFATALPSFPEEWFIRIFEMHSALVAELVLERFGASDSGKKPCIARAQANALSLAAFSVEWF